MKVGADAKFDSLVSVEGPNGVGPQSTIKVAAPVRPGFGVMSGKWADGTKIFDDVFALRDYLAKRAAEADALGKTLPGEALVITPNGRGWLITCGKYSILFLLGLDGKVSAEDYEKWKLEPLYVEERRRVTNFTKWVDGGQKGEEPSERNNWSL